jgi:hypothetical protein
MIAPSGTSKAREPCGQTTSMIALSGTFKRVNHAIKQRVRADRLVTPLIAGEPVTIDITSALDRRMKAEWAKGKR